MKVYIARCGSEITIYKYKKDAILKCKEDGRVFYKGFYVYEKNDITEYDYWIEEHDIKEKY